MVSAAAAARTLEIRFPWKRAMTLAMMVAWDTTDTKVTATPTATTTSHWAGLRCMALAVEPLAASAARVADRMTGRSTTVPIPMMASWMRKAKTGTAMRPGSSRTMEKPMPTRRRPRRTLPPVAGVGRTMVWVPHPESADVAPPPEMG